MKKGTVHVAILGNKHPLSSVPVRYCLCGEAIVQVGGAWWHLTPKAKALTDSGPHGPQRIQGGKP